MQLTCRAWVYSPLTLITMIGGKLHIPSKTPTSVNAWPSFHWLSLSVSLLTTVKSQCSTVLTTMNTMGEKKLYYLTCTKHNCTSVQPIFNWTTLLTGHKQGDSRICLVPTTSKIKCKLLSQFHYRCHTHMYSNKTYLQLCKFQIMELLYRQVFQIDHPINGVTCLIFAT